MGEKELKYLIFQAKEVKDTLRLTGNIYDCRNEKTAYSRGFVRSETYIDELIQKLETKQLELTAVVQAKAEVCDVCGYYVSPKDGTCLKVGCDNF